MMMTKKVKLIFFEAPQHFEGLTWLTPTLFILRQIYAIAKMTNVKEFHCHMRMNLQPYEENRICLALFHIWHRNHRTTFSSAAAVITSNWQWRSHSIYCCARPLHLHWLWRLNEVTRHEDRLCLLRCAAAATKHSSVRSSIRSPVTGDISSWRGWITETQPSLASLYDQAASVGDELSCPASLRLVEVRPYRSTSPSTPLVDGSGANRFQARSPCLQVSARSSTFVPCPWTPRTVTLDVVYDPPRHNCWLSTVNHRRSSFPVRCCPCLKRFAAPRHVGTISGCLPQSPQDAPLQALLSMHNPIPLLCPKNSKNIYF